MDKVRKNKMGFTLVEILIVVAIIGILAALVVPLLEDQSQKAKESAAKENLRVLRNAIELYAAQHNGTPPGYPSGNSTGTPTLIFLTQQLCWATNPDGAYAAPGTTGYPFGPYLPAIPVNPFNDKPTIQVLANSNPFPTSATGTFGWIYKPLTKTIKLNYPGTDSEGTQYFDY